MKKIIFALLTMFMLYVPVTHTMACTSVIVSGKITKDGRPLLFKNRDTSKTDNVAVLIQGERYRYIGIVAANDLTPNDVWGGHNEVGFGIINTAAYNLNGCEGKDSNGDGEFMKRALEICRTMADFEHYLDTLAKPMDLNSNFAILDADGHCAYYETSNTGYVKFDVNDPKVAPNGYLMRTNHGMTGCRSIDIGVERYMAITDFMTNAQQQNTIDMMHLMTDIPRCLTHGLTKINLYDIMPQHYNDTKMFPIRDYIMRWSTSSAIMVQGIKAGESPLMTISWTNIGWPPASVSVPLLITPSGKLPDIVGRNDDGGSWLCRKAMKEKEKVFNAKSGNTHDYIDIAKLINHDGTGILQRVLPIEKEVMRRGVAVLDNIRSMNNQPKGKKKKAPTAEDILQNYYTWVDVYVKENYPE